MWLGAGLHHLWVVSLDGFCAQRRTAMPVRGGDRCLSVADYELVTNNRELVAEVIDQNIQLTAILMA
jgi:hypothetical protein